MADEDGTIILAQSYTPFGEPLWSQGSGTTTYGFTGEQWGAYTGLLFLRARYYEPQTGRFVTRDIWSGNREFPQTLNRWSYGYNNPVKFWDPSGHDPIDADWEQRFYDEHGRWPTEQDKRDRLFSIMFLGSGPEGTWTDQDWAFYHANRDELWGGGVPWPGAEAPGVDRFVLHLRRLTSKYKADEHRQFVRAFALVFGGVPYDRPWTLAAVSVMGGPHTWNPLYEGDEGWNRDLVDDANPSHHYAGLFFLGYFTQVSPLGKLVNYARDSDNQPDIALGDIAVEQGVHFRLGYTECCSGLRSYRAWIWALEEALSVVGTGY